MKMIVMMVMVIAMKRTVTFFEDYYVPVYESFPMHHLTVSSEL